MPYHNAVGHSDSDEASRCRLCNDGLQVSLIRCEIRSASMRRTLLAPTKHRPLNDNGHNNTSTTVF